MRALIQRVSRARVECEGREVAAIGPGLLVLAGVRSGDDGTDVERLAAKIRALRIFDGADGRMNEPLGDREILCVSQFTLHADTARGNRPSFIEAASAEAARPLYEQLCEALDAKRGAFGERMSVELTNDGPVTLMLDTRA